MAPSLIDVWIIWPLFPIPRVGDSQQPLPIPSDWSRDLIGPLAKKGGKKRHKQSISICWWCPLAASGYPKKFNRKKSFFFPFRSRQWQPTQSFVVNDEEAFGGAISLPRAKVKGHAFHWEASVKFSTQRRRGVTDQWTSSALKVPI